MIHKGAGAYEQEDFFGSFLSRRLRKESPNNVMEKPVILELLGEVNGKSILDLGCGEGLIGAELIELGAAHYTGIDGSKNMVDRAKKTIQSDKAALLLCDLEELEAEEEQYDLLLSRMVLHYIKSLQHVMNAAYTSLKPGGKFVFSVMHPVITATFDHFSGKEKRTHWIVDNYFDSGERIESWMDHSVMKYHRTIEEYITLSLNAGFKIKNLKEAAPVKEAFEDEKEYERRKRIPLMLILELEKS